MSEAETILKMIESVSPDDAEKLDEIDARVWCLLNRQNPDEPVYQLDKDGKIFNGCKVPYWQEYPLRDVQNPMASYRGYKCTRSRDALKAIRLEYKNCFFSIVQDYDWYWQATLEVAGEKEFISPELPTEELAELHASVQAIEFKRKSATKEPKNV